MIVKYETYSYIVNKQKILDAAFLPVARWQPNFDDRHLSLQVEKGEFIKEFQKVYKWWKRTAENNVPEILNEYIDLWHFVAGIILTEHAADFDGIYFEIRETVEREHEFLKHFDEEFHLKQLLIRVADANYYLNMLGIATAIIEKLGFTDQQIKEAYDIKNAENFERIAAGY